MAGRPSARAIGAVATLLIHLVATSAAADLFNQRNQLIGERAALMGGAFTALANDISAAYYNPAGLAYGPRFRVSLSGSAYSYVNERRTEKSPSLETPTELGNSRFNIIPTTFGLSFRVSDRVVLGLSVFELDHPRFDAVSFSTGGIVIDRGRGPVRYEEQVLRIRLETQSILSGPSVAWRVHDDLSLGLSVFYHYFQGSSGNSTILSNAAGDQEQSVTQSELSSGGLVLNFGLLWRPLPGWRFGLTYSSETLPITGTNTFFIGGVNSQGITLVEKGEVRGDVRLPSRLTLGIAYERPGSFALSFDATVYFSMWYSAPREVLRIADPMKAHVETEHLDLALGAEYVLSERWVLRGGLYTNTSGATREDADLRINHIGATFGLGYVKQGLSTGLGLNVMVGQTGYQSVPGSASQVEWRRVQVQLVYGGSARFFE
jgi:long-chain fatty acid transport protein